MISSQNEKQFKGTCQNCSKYDLKAVNCPEKKSDEKRMTQALVQNIISAEIISIVAK